MRVPAKPKMFHIWPFYGKSLLTPDLEKLLSLDCTLKSPLETFHTLFLVLGLHNAQAGIWASVYFHSSPGDSHFSVSGGPRFPGYFPHLASVAISNLVPATLSVPCPGGRVSLGLPGSERHFFCLETSDGGGAGRQGFQVSTAEDWGCEEGADSRAVLHSPSYSHSKSWSSPNTLGRNIIPRLG